jgi:hypothetical protein
LTRSGAFWVVFVLVAEAFSNPEMSLKVDFDSNTE